MAELTTIARPYAEAAFALAKEQGALPQWSSMLKLASRVVADPKVADALDNPKLDAGAKESLLLSICGEELSKEGRNFVRVLVEADRIVAAAKAEIEQEVARAKEQLRDSVADLAVAGASQILKRDVDRNVHAQLLAKLKSEL